ncbi:hypothetical protein WME95_40865 [Sorangium sp. So ce327]|uniref:hypothetical protein n=1 Tax=Sorangium sp. So ce327 TaxID=3133301 RepID=UPI003F5D84DD
MLLEQHDVDLDRIFDFLGELEAALGEDRLLRRLERQIRKACATGCGRVYKRTEIDRALSGTAPTWCMLWLSARRLPC